MGASRSDTGVLSQHMPFVSDIIARTVESPECLTYTLRLCFELSGTKKNHKALLKSGVLNFCHSITSNLPKKTIQLFLGIVIRLGHKDNPPEVLKGLLKHELALRGFLSSLKVPALQHLVNLALQIIDRLKKKMENDPSAFATNRLVRKDSMDLSDEESDSLPGPSRTQSASTVINVPSTNAKFSLGMSEFTYSSMREPPSLLSDYNMNSSTFRSLKSYNSDLDYELNSPSGRSGTPKSDTLPEVPVSISPKETEKNQPLKSRGSLPKANQSRGSDAAIKSRDSVPIVDDIQSANEYQIRDSIAKTPTRVRTNASSRVMSNSVSAPPRSGGSIVVSPRGKPKPPVGKPEQARRQSSAPPRQQLNKTPPRSS